MEEQHSSSAQFHYVSNVTTTASILLIYSIIIGTTYVLNMSSYLSDVLLLVRYIGLCEDKKRLGPLEIIYFGINVHWL